MKFNIQHSLLLSFGLLSFSVNARPGEPYYDAAHLIRRDNSTGQSNGTSTGGVIPSSSRPSLPPVTILPSNAPTSRGPSSAPPTTNPPTITSPPVSSSATTSAPPATTTVSNGDTIVVAAGVVVVGGTGGGSFTIAGSGAAPVAVAAGTTVTAGSSSEGDNPDNPEQTTKPPESSEPPTSTEPTSTEPTSSAPSGTPTPCLIFPKDGATSQDNTDFISLLDKELGKGKYRETTDTVQLFVSANITEAQNATLTADPLVNRLVSLYPALLPLAWTHKHHRLAG